MRTTFQPEERFMREALRAARRGVDRGQSPFGACLVREGRVVVRAHNTVWSAADPTAHAEINAIRKAARRLGSIDLSGCVIYSTCEPCPMCFSAIHWARLETVVFGARISDAARLGFNELAISDLDLKRLGKSPVRIVEDFMRDPCLDIFRDWASRRSPRAY